MGLDKPISEIEAAVAKKLKFDASSMSSFPVIIFSVHLRAIHPKLAFGHRVALRYNDPDAGDDLLGSVLLQVSVCCCLKEVYN